MIFNPEKQVLNKGNTAWNNLAKYILFQENGVEDIKSAINHINESREFQVQVEQAFRMMQKAPRFKEANSQDKAALIWKMIKKSA